MKLQSHKINLNKVRIINNPVVSLNLCTMRDKNTDAQGMRIAARKITRCLLYEAAKNLPLVDSEITTPLATFTTKTIDNDIEIIISPILRAGLIFTDEAIDILRDFPDTDVLVEVIKYDKPLCVNRWEI